MSDQSQGRWRHRFAPGVSVAFGVALAAYVLALGVADLFSVSRPGLSLALDAGRTDARLALATQAFARQPPDLEKTRAHARAALARDPLASPALTILGRAAEEAGDVATAEKLMKLAVATASRDVFAHAWMLAHEAGAENWVAAVARLDWILRVTPQARYDSVFPVVAPFFDSPNFVGPLGAVLAAGPPWRGSMLSYLTRLRGNTRALWALFTELQSGPLPPSGREMAPYLNRLVSEGWFDQAYLAWLTHVPAERLANDGLLFNARFLYPIENMPFDWTIAQSPGVLVRVEGGRGNRELNADFFGTRIASSIINHLLMLPPGEYRFSGRERAQNLETERGLRWRLFCVEGQEASLLETPFLSGDQPWRTFSFDFNVAETCRVQKLQLELPARVALESVIAGAASFAALGIEAR